MPVWKMRRLLDNLLIRRSEFAVVHLKHGENATKWSDTEQVCTNNTV